MITNTKLFLSLLIAQLMSFQIDWSGVYVFMVFRMKHSEVRDAVSALSDRPCVRNCGGCYGCLRVGAGGRHRRRDLGVYIFTRVLRARERIRVYTRARCCKRCAACLIICILGICAGSTSPNARVHVATLRVYASKGRKGERVPYLQPPVA